MTTMTTMTIRYCRTKLIDFNPPLSPTAPRRCPCGRSIEIYRAYAGPGGHGGMAVALNDLGYVLWDACANPVFVGQGEM